MERIGKYKITGELGRGAMGIVYKGEDPLIGRTVAIKTIRMEAFHKPHEQAEATQRFIREAQSAGNLSHSNIVTIYDVGQSEGTTYIAMEYIEGKSLDMLIAMKKEHTLDDIITLISQIASALDYAHEKGVVHRDIKPGNILIDNSGRPHIVDFGIARISSSTLTQTGTTLGTPNYMSPEQVAGRKVDHRADIFALGAILYELLTFEKPFSGDSFTTIIYKIMNEDPPPLRTFNARMPEDLDLIIRKALAKKAEDRYQTCKDLISDLSNYQTLGTTLVATGPISLAADKKKTKKLQVPEKKREKEKSEKIRKEKVTAPAESKKKKSRKGILLLFGLIGLLGIAAATYYFVFLKGARPIDSSTQAALTPSETEVQTQPQVPEETPPAPTEIAALLESGIEAFDSGDYDLCIKNMEKVLELDPQQSQAESLLNEAKKKQAEQQQERDLENSIQFARSSFSKQNFTESIQQAERALSIDPGNTEARDLLIRSLLQLGVQHFEKEEYPQTIDKMEQVLKIDPKNKTALDYADQARNKQAELSKDLDTENTFLLAEQANNNQNYQECIQLTEKILVQDNQNSRARELWAQAHFQLGIQAFDKENFQTSIQHMEAVLKIEPQNKEALASITSSQAGLKAQRIEDLLNRTAKAFGEKNYEESFELAAEILVLEPNNKRAREYSDQSSLQLAPKQINFIINEYNQSVKDNNLTEFYSKWCTPEFYQTIKVEIEKIVKSFSDLKISLTDVSIQFQEVFHAQVSFNQVLTGVSVSDGVTNVLSDGKMEWEIKKSNGDWKITEMSYTHRK
jgi:tRNA A-37 threonylcarbamoyl transferase component Bud32/tetratricopeptide (TPR) repeat protein